MATREPWRYVDPADDHALADLVDESQVRPADVDAATLLDVGLSYVAIQQYEQAIETFARAVRFADDDGVRAEALVNAGVAHAELEEYDEAIGAAREAIRLDPDPDVAAVAHVNLAYALWELGDSTRPVAHAERAVELDPRLPQAWFDLGFYDAERGLYAEAKASLENARRLGLRNRWVDEELARAADRLDEHETETERATTEGEPGETDDDRGPPELERPDSGGTGVSETGSRQPGVEEPGAVASDPRRVRE